MKGNSITDFFKVHEVGWGWPLPRVPNNWTVPVDRDQA